VTQSDTSIAIIGGGIGGIAAALSLLRAGFDVQVYEQARSPTEVGAGIQVSPNATRILERLGLAGELARIGVLSEAIHQRRWQDGRTLLRSPLGRAVAEHFGAAHYQCHRGDLLFALAGALPPERLHLGHRLTGLIDHGDRVEARFENGARVTADMLVGADGIHSAVRGILLGPESPRFTNCVAYRGMVPAERLAHLDIENTSTVWMGPGRHFVHYFVSGGRLLNFVALMDHAGWQRESWTDRGNLADVKAAYADWHPQIGAILGAADETFIWALFDRAPLPRWSSGRVTLLGDACHPMLPFMAQGAAQAIEDGATLAACLVRFGIGDIPATLSRYEALRLPRAARLQAMSAINKQRFHLPDGPEQQARDAEMARGTTDWSLAAIAWVYGHDAGVLDDPGN
jgi:2-polyprenyl-6-methoxyphenol hydroxylase-like FAD-dependent oxidoreductase